jgi:pimeloyl-ACP methyl ester carboxylesterase
MWLEYMQLFASKGYPCYAVSYRAHGNSWYPGFWRMYFTTRAAIGGDLVAGIEHVEHLERERRQKDDVKVVLIAHSAGGALSQYVLSRGQAKVSGYCMFAAVPGFGSYVSLTHPL